MENSQSDFIDSERQGNQDQNISGDHYWKAFYSHSFTALFNCENCNHEFEIDGWFYKFDTVTCPKCQTSYTGFFGRVLPTNQSDCIDMETFDGQKVQISLKSHGKSFPGLVNHIILVLSSKVHDQQGKLWGIIDYSVAKPHIQLLAQMSTDTVNRSEKREPAKSKSLLSMLFG